MRPRLSLVRFAALAVSLAATATVVGAAPPVVAGGGPYVFPDCAPTLQQCIDAHPTETIFIATEVVPEDIDITTGTTLIAAQGFTPTINGFDIQLATGTRHVILRGLTIANGIRANMSGGTGHSVTIERVRVEGFEPFNGVGIVFQARVPGTFHLERSTLIMVPSGGLASSVALETSLITGSTTFRAIGNRIRQNGSTGSAGIFVRHTIAGTHRVDLMNNSIWDVGACQCGMNSGISLVGQDMVNVDANVVGNTIERSAGFGIALRNLVDPGGAYALDLYDNVVAHTDQDGLWLDSTINGALTFRNGYNDFFATGSNDLDGQSLGSSNLSLNPRFVDRANGNLNLRSTSPLIDAGLVCTPGGIANPDAAGNHRLKGASVDIGAYEFGAAPPTGQIVLGGPSVDVLTGNEGADIICGYAGADQIAGLGGPDYLDGGSDADLMFGGSGKDAHYGRAGADQLCAGDGIRGNDRADGGPGVDRYRADPGDTLISVEQRNADCN